MSDALLMLFCGVVGGIVGAVVVHLLDGSQRRQAEQREADTWIDLMEDVHREAQRREDRR